MNATDKAAVTAAPVTTPDLEIYQRRSRVLLDALSALMADHLYVKNLNQSYRHALNVVAAIQAGDL